MAVSTTTTTTTVCIPNNNNIHTPTKSNLGFSNRLTYTPKPRNLRITISNSSATSSDFSPEEDATTATQQADPDTAIEVPDQPPSLISALNVERALRGIPITDVDHYGRLGIPRGTSYEKVAVAYSNKVEELKKEGLEEEELDKKLQQLKESYSILSSEQERRLYDWSLARTEITDKYVWPHDVDITEISSKGTPPPQEPEDVGPTRVVGYVLLGWVIISVLLSIVLM